MGLAEQWRSLEAGLPPNWAEARVELRLERPADASLALAQLAPLAPLQTDDDRLALRITRDGSGPSAEGLRRGLARLDEHKLAGRVRVVGSEAGPATVAATSVSLVESWAALLATLPGDWSDLVGEIELDSSDYLDLAAVSLAPLNPRRTGAMTTLRFRSASRFGYGASPGMVRVCLARCDHAAIRGRVKILRVLCDTHPVGTQGPVWQIDGETV
jgi:hypothetical protein